MAPKVGEYVFAPSPAGGRQGADSLRPGIILFVDPDSDVEPRYYVKFTSHLVQSFYESQLESQLIYQEVFSM